MHILITYLIISTNQHGADVNAVRSYEDRKGITALHLAAENGFTETVRALIEEKSCNLNSADSLGFVV